MTTDGNPSLSGTCSPRKPQKNPSSHKGLWFERYFNQYDRNWIIPKPKNNEDSSEKEWIDQVTNGKCGDPKSLTSYALSQKKLCDDLLGKSQIFKNNWHFVTGMGNNHPVENGMTWHPTLGTPYLTGASVKGLLRSWMEEWSGFEDDALKEKLFRWFGSDDKDPIEQQLESQAGSLIFFDALPIAPVILNCDIMTPHMGKWYSNGSKISKEMYSECLPADWHNPIPIPFLVVKQASLQFNIAPRPHAEISTEEIQEAMAMLSMALEYLGAGAKTATGYGRFSIDTDAENKQEKAEKESSRAKMRPEERFADELKDIKEKDLAEMFGRKYTKTKENYENKEVSWEMIINILMTEKKELLVEWSKADKKTAQGKAFKKLRDYL